MSKWLLACGLAFLVSGELMAELLPAASSETYCGLVYETNHIVQETSGSLSVTVSRFGRFSATMLLGGRKVSWSGSFGRHGSAVNDLPRPGLPSLHYSMQLGLPGSGELEGSLTDGQWTAQILAHTSPFEREKNPCPYAGAYTASFHPSLRISFPGNEIDPSFPAGYGYGTFSVAQSGRVHFRGRLADGTPLTQTSFLSESGDWPFYSALYARQGSAFGWLKLAPSTNVLVYGQLNWIKPPISDARFYPAGFTDELLVHLSPFLPPDHGQRVMHWTNGRIIVLVGNLSNQLNMPISLRTDNTITGDGTNQLAINFSPRSGLFSGALIPYGTTNGLSFQGAVLQRLDSAFGYFLTSNQSGYMALGVFPGGPTNLPPPHLPPPLPGTSHP